MKRCIPQVQSEQQLSFGMEKLQEAMLRTMNCIQKPCGSRNQKCMNVGHSQVLKRGRYNIITLHKYHITHILCFFFQNQKKKMLINCKITLDHCDKSELTTKYSQPFIFVSYTSVDSTNPGWKIFRKKKNQCRVVSVLNRYTLFFLSLFTKYSITTNYTAFTYQVLYVQR